MGGTCRPGLGRSSGAPTWSPAHDALAGVSEVQFAHSSRNGTAADLLGCLAMLSPDSIQKDSFMPGDDWDK